MDQLKGSPDLKLMNSQVSPKPLLYFVISILVSMPPQAAIQTFSRARSAYKPATHNLRASELTCQNLVTIQ